MIKRHAQRMLPNVVAGTVAGLLCWPAMVGANCLEAAATYHRVSPTLVGAIARVESGMQPRARNRNKNGTEDLGLMQINSMHLPRLARYGVTRERLFDPCINAYVGAWILADCIRRYGQTWNAVGCYNAGAPDKRLRYAHRVYRMLQSTTSPTNRGVQYR